MIFLGLYEVLHVGFEGIGQTTAHNCSLPSSLQRSTQNGQKSIKRAMAKQEKEILIEKSILKICYTYSQFWLPGAY